MNKTDIGVAVYETQSQAELAVKLLHGSGFDMKLISILGKDYPLEEKRSVAREGDQGRFYSKLSALWMGLTGVLLGSAQLFIPSVGHIFVLGPLASMVAGAVQGALIVNSVSALFAVLGGAGVPKDSLLHYETLLNTDKFLLLVHGNAEAFQWAHEVLTARSTYKSSSPGRQRNFPYDWNTLKRASLNQLSSIEPAEPTLH
jgi:hypothetical protein